MTLGITGGGSSASIQATSINTDVDNMLRIYTYHALNCTEEGTNMNNKTNKQWFPPNFIFGKHDICTALLTDLPYAVFSLSSK